MFDTGLFQRHGFHDSVIEKIKWVPQDQSLYVYGEFDEWEYTDNSGCREYWLVFQGIRELDLAEGENFQDSGVIKLGADRLDEGYHVVLALEKDSGDQATMEFTCGNIRYYFYKYKGISYRNVYGEEGYQAQFKKAQLACREKYFEKTKTLELGEGYSVRMDTYNPSQFTKNEPDLLNLYLKNVLCFAVKRYYTDMTTYIVKR